MLCLAKWIYVLLLFVGVRWCAKFSTNFASNETSSRCPSPICLLKFLEIIASANQLPLHSSLAFSKHDRRKLFRNFPPWDFHKTKLKLGKTSATSSHTAPEWLVEKRKKCWSMGKLKIIILNKQKPIVGRDIFGLPTWIVNSPHQFDERAQGMLRMLSYSN